MIGYLKGTLIHQDHKSVILNVSGVGYKIYTNTGKVEGERLKVKSEIELWTYLAVRENALDLYGFKTKEELSFFELLISVSGIGPKGAISILNVATLPNLRRAISTGDTSHLTKVSGIGKKNAEKIVIELKDKITGLVAEDGGSMSGEVDALEALRALGFGEREAREALKKVADVSDTGEKVKKALKLLS
ncbi:MAG TPA: Holliday junction branch migration protein RuvA [Candidatus Paceibacterota bacterium]